MPLSPPTITSIRVDWDEDACFALIQFDGDSYLSQYTITDPEAFYDAVKAGIGPWLHERELARKTLPTASVALPGNHEGYDPDDPKHTNWHSVHADLYDTFREGK